MSSHLNPLLYPFPAQLESTTEYLKLKDHIKLMLPDGLSQDFFLETWKKFTGAAICVEVLRNAALPANNFILTTSDSIPSTAVLQSGMQSCLRIDKHGIAGCGTSLTDMKYAWNTLMQLIVKGRGDSAGFWLIPHVCIQDRPLMKFRGIHLCIFPETSLDFIERIVRLAGFLKYSHVILEFWGMLKYDCLDALSWPNAFSKSEVKRIIDMAALAGLKTIPMFNHWGHATACRVSNGKHVVLDQRPELEALFEPDGWTWCLSNPDAKSLLKELRSELIELSGTDDYFHLGCDEAYSHASCPECMKKDAHLLLADYLNEVNADLKKSGLRPMIWGDTLMRQKDWDGYIALGTESQRTDRVIETLSRDFIICDWQYYLKEPSLDRSAKYFIDHGFDLITAPWYECPNISCEGEIAIKHNALGMLLTTWHTLPTTMNCLHHASEVMWGGDARTKTARRTHPLSTIAAFQRKLRGSHCSYEEAGWREHEVDESSQI